MEFEGFLGSLKEKQLTVLFDNSPSPYFQLFVVDVTTFRTKSSRLTIYFFDFKSAPTLGAKKSVQVILFLSFSGRY